MQNSTPLWPDTWCRDMPQSKLRVVHFCLCKVHYPIRFGSQTDLDPIVSCSALHCTSTLAMFAFASPALLTRPAPTRFGIHNHTRPKRARARFVMTKRVLVAVGDGSEEIETSTAVDVLRRAGANLTLASVGASKSCKLSRGMVYEADTLMSESASGAWDAVVVPGGMPGAKNCAESEPLVSALRRTADEGGVVAAICAAPAVVLAPLGLLNGKRATCYPAPPFEKAMPDRIDEGVVVDGTLVTATGPGTALPWALKIVEVLYGEKAAGDVASAMLVELPQAVGSS